MDKVKYFLFLLMILFLSMSFCAASDSDNITQSNIQTQSVVDDVTSSSIIQENENIQEYDNNMNYKQDDIDENILTENKVVQKKTQDNIKTQENTNITTITQDNYNDYLSISTSGKVTLKTTYFVPGNNYTIEFAYLPEEANQLVLNNFYNNKYKNDSIKIVGTINDVSMVVGGGSLKSLILEDLTINYNPDFTGDYVDVTSQSILNRVNINVDTQRNGSSVPLRITGNNTVVENCTINARLPSTQIDWEGTSIPYGIGVFINAYNVTFANNVVDIEESEILTSTGFYRSLYGMLIRGSYHRLHNNTLFIQGSQYTYAIVLRSSCNNITNNNITAISEYYTAGINIEGYAIVNNTICNNYLNVVAGYDVTDNGNAEVAYACLILDYSCGGQYYVATSRSMYNNNYTNNTVICEGRQVYGFEIWGGVNATINNNNITAIGTLPMGIGAIGINTTMNNNTINIYGTSNSTEGSADYIKPRTAGIYAYGMKEGNTITNNIIYSENGRALLFEEAENVQVENNFLITEEYAYVIEVDSKNNTFKNNAILGEGTVDEVIRDKTDNENTYINNREPLSSQLTIDANKYVKPDEEVSVVISLVDESANAIPDQFVQVQVGDENVQTFVTDDEGKIGLTFTPTQEKTIIKTDYECYGDYGSSAAKEITMVEPIELTPETFDTYITGGLLNDNVPSGAFIDVSGKFDGERYAFNITKPVNIYSSAGDAFLCFYSTATSESGSELPQNSFIIEEGGSGTNVSDIYFENTEILVLNAHDVVLDNLTVYCTEGYGWGRGSTSIRNSDHVTIRNSYFNTTDDNGVSTVVFAASQDSTIENCTVCGSGFIGNLVYTTTYNVEVEDQYGNNNITIRNNKIIGRDLMTGVATCYSVCVIGDNITIENNYIENSNNFLIMTQYKDDDYEVEGDTGFLIIRNNSFDKGKISVNFDPCTIENNTFYGNVTLDVTDNTITNNNIVCDEFDNPYLYDDEPSSHPTNISIDAPDTYIYDDEITLNVTVTDTTLNTTLNTGYLEVYADGTLYDNITINSSITTFTYANETLGVHRVRVWYYSCDEGIANTQKLATTEAIPIKGQLVLSDMEAPHIGDDITLTVSYTLSKDVDDDVYITFTLPGQDDITVQAKNNAASINTTITTDYIRDILGGREQNIKITANTDNPNVEITGINTKLGVQKATTSITITPENATVNEATIFKATITTPTDLTISTGSITFTDADGNTIATGNIVNNQATANITFNTIGTNMITATYAGTTYYAPATTTTAITVNEKPIIKEDVTISIDTINDITQGTNVTITGKFTKSDGSPIKGANLKVSLNGVKYTAKTDKTGTYTVSQAVDTIGPNNVTVSYAGNTKYNAYEASTTFNVNAGSDKQNPTITINNIETVALGSDIKISGTLKNSAGKALTNVNIKISINGITTSVKTDKTGTYSLAAVADTAGTNNITATYAGNSKYNAASAKTTYTVTQDTSKLNPILTVDSIENVQYGDTITIHGTFKNPSGKALTSANLKISVNGIKTAVKTDKNGTYSLTITANTTGDNNIVVIYTGNSKYNPTRASTSFTVKQDTQITINPITNAKVNEAVTISGTFKNDQGKAITSANLKVKLNGVTTTVKTDSKGVYTLTTTNTIQGTNNITVTYPGNTKYNKSTIQSTFTCT